MLGSGMNVDHRARELRRFGDRDWRNRRVGVVMVQDGRTRGFNEVNCVTWNAQYRRES